MTNPADRPLAHLSHASRKYPTAWKVLEELRGLRGRKELEGWPSWCYMPLAGGLEVVTHGQDSSNYSMGERIGLAREAAVITALATWRQTKGIYQFHPELLEALWHTPVTGDLPTEILKRLPEWCVYLPLEHKLTSTRTLYGAWVHLEWDANDHSEELRLVVDFGDEMLPIPIDLVGTLEEGMKSVILDGIMRSGDVRPPRNIDGTLKAQLALAEPIVSLVLYLCSEAPEIDGKGRPGNPQPKKVKGGMRVFPAGAPRIWGVGSRVGAELLKAREQTKSSVEGDDAGRSRPRPHLRRAHWAVRWTGPRSGEQTPVLRWIQPTLVAADTDEELPATIRPVNPEQPDLG